VALGALALAISLPVMADTVSSAQPAQAAASGAVQPLALSGPGASTAPVAALPLPAPGAPVFAPPRAVGVAAPMPAAPAQPDSAAPASAQTGTPAAAPVAATQPATPAAPARPAAPEPSRVRVVYLSDTDRAKILAELKQDVLQTAKDDNWAQPNTFPEWVNRIHFSGDIMFRGEADLFDKNNYANFVNFQAMNAKGPTNIVPTGSVTNPLVLPFLNTTEDRYLPRLRVHVGMFAQVSDDMEAILRFSTGNTTNPGTASVTLGDDFAQQDFLFDRAYMNYRPSADSAIALGRMGNPWATPDDMVWARELAFDGLAVQTHPQLSRHTTLIATAGAFSVLNTDPTVTQSQPTGLGSHGDWLYGAQLGFDWQGDGDSARVTAAYYDFDNLQGLYSSPCLAYTAAVSCDTDNSVPDFMQKGNTVFAVRNVPSETGVSTQTNYQYFGLASAFRELNLTGTFDQVLQGPLHIAADIDYVDNLAFSRRAVEARGQGPLNNQAPCPASNPNCTQAYVGGGQGEQLQLRVGYPKVSERGQWSAVLGYRDVESDAVVDAFNDQDFHLGGTNAKGYFIGGSLGFTHNAWVTARWMSATEDSGEPMAIDVLQIDVNARF